MPTNNVLFLDGKQSIMHFVRKNGIPYAIGEKRTLTHNKECVVIQLKNRENDILFWQEIEQPKQGVPSIVPGYTLIEDVVQIVGKTYRLWAVAFHGEQVSGWSTKPHAIKKKRIFETHAKELE